MQKYGICITTRTQIQQYLASSLLNVNIFKKQNLGASKISSVGKVVYHLTQV